MRCEIARLLKLSVVLVTVGVLGHTSLHAQDAPTDWVYPIDVAVAPDGTIYIADLRLPGLWKLTDGKLDLIKQASKKFRTPLNAIRCVHVDADGVLYAGDSATREVYRVYEDGELTPLANAIPGIPTAIGVHGETLYVTDLELQRVWKLPKAGLEEGAEPETVAVLGGPRGLDIDGDGNIWILSPLKPQLRRLSPEGEETVLVDDLVFNFPHQVLVNDDGSAIVSDGYEHCLWKVAADGSTEKWVEGEPFVNPLGLAHNGDNILVLDSRAPGLFSVNPDGEVTKLYPPE